MTDECPAAIAGRAQETGGAKGPDAKGQRTKRPDAALREGVDLQDVRRAREIGRSTESGAENEDQPGVGDFPGARHDGNIQGLGGAAVSRYPLQRRNRPETIRPRAVDEV